MMPAGTDPAPIRALFFDMNGTLRVRQAHAPTSRRALARLQALIGTQVLSEAFITMVEERGFVYRRATKADLRQVDEATLWTRWLLPEADPAHIARHAPELMLAWVQRKGRHVPKPGALAVLQELRRRGYRLGVISNSMSSLDIPACLAAFGWQDLFETVLLSVQVGARKPSPLPYQEAARRLGLAPQACAYLGNRAEKDIPGARQAGFALTILLNDQQPPAPPPADPACQPDHNLHSFEQVLALFPSLPRTEPSPHKETPCLLST